MILVQAGGWCCVGACAVHIHKGQTEMSTASRALPATTCSQTSKPPQPPDGTLALNTDPRSRKPEVTCFPNNERFVVHASFTSTWFSRSQVILHGHVRPRFTPAYRSFSCVWGVRAFPGCYGVISSASAAPNEILHPSYRQRR